MRCPFHLSWILPVYRPLNGIPFTIDLWAIWPLSLSERRGSVRVEFRGDTLVLERSPESKMLQSPASSYHMARKAG